MKINAAIVHGISKESQSKIATPQKANALLPANAHLQRIAGDVLKFYGQMSNGYGIFEDNQELHPFPKWLTNYYGSGGGFVAFTYSTTEKIANEMGEQFFATGGYVLFIRYENLDRDWLIIAMLKLKQGTTIDPEHLTLNEVTSLDVEHLHEAARVDLAKWKESKKPYLSFIKRRDNKGQVSHYFRKALGCAEYTDAKHNTEQMRQAFDAYCVKKQWNDEQKQAGREKIFDYCEERSKAGEHVIREALSVLVNDQEPQDFDQFIRESDYSVGGSFSPHRPTFTRLKRVSRTFGSVKLSFDVQDLYDKRVAYDDMQKCLIIRDVPIALIDEMRSFQKSNA